MDDLSGYYGEDLEVDNEAEKIMAVVSGQKPKPLPGRPISIDDDTLLSARAYLIWLFEETWYDVGEHLPWIKKPSDVLNAITSWDNPNLSIRNEFIPKTLLRPSSIPVTQKWLTAKRDELAKLNVAVSAASDKREKCRESLETAQRAMSDNLSERDKAAVADQIAKRAQRLSDAKTEYDALDKLQVEVQRLVHDGEASFARNEFVKFIESNRYRLTPLNLANALAGLPFIGWRQSVNRCQKHPCTRPEGKSIQIFKTIERIVKSCVRRADLGKHAELWLKNRRTKKSDGASALREKWYYLSWSIKTVLESDPRIPTRNLPFAITREYWNRIRLPSNVDRLFEEEERIVI